MRNTYPNLTRGRVATVTRVGDLGLRASFALETTKHLLRCVARISIVRSIVVVVLRCCFAKLGSDERC